MARQYWRIDENGKFDVPASISHGSCPSRILAALSVRTGIRFIVDKELKPEVGTRTAIEKDVDKRDRRTGIGNGENGMVLQRASSAGWK